MTLASAAVNRRCFLNRTSQGLFGVALASLLEPGLLRAAPSGGVLGKLPLPQKAKRVIWLTMAGGPSHLELFDYKPKLGELDGQPMPESLTRGQQLAQLQGQKLVCLGPQFPFQKYGQSGIEISTLLPQFGAAIDDVCLVRSMTTEAINHDPAHMFMNTGSQIAGRPSMGAWVTYGLGSEAEDLPGFVVLVSTGKGRSPQPIAARQWSSGFLPSRFQGVQLRSKGDPVLYLGRPAGVSLDQQAADVASDQRVEPQPRRCGARSGDRHADRPVRAGVRDADERTRADGFGRRRRPDHRAVRLRTGGRLLRLQLPAGPAIGAAGGTLHPTVPSRLGPPQPAPRGAAPARREVDQACAALIADLKHMGMFDETLIVWSGEFGRTPMSQSNKGPVGRDHHNKSMSLWLAGAGVRGGLAYGATDDLGYSAVEQVCTVHDLHATMLHQLGIQHDAFSVKFQGLDAKLTGVERARVLREILA